MTLILKHNLDIVKMYHHTKNEVSTSTGSKVIERTDKHTDRQTDRQADRQTDTHRHCENMTSTAYAGGKKKLNTYCRLGEYNSVTNLNTLVVSPS